MAKKRYAATPVQRLTLKQLLQVTGRLYPDILNRSSSQCNIVRREYAMGNRDGFNRSQPDSPPLYNEMRSYAICTNGKRSSYIRFYGPPKADSPCWVWCSCQYFTYNLEVALTNQNSSSVNLSNGARPRVRNVRMVPHLCKHLVTTAKIALRENKDLVSEFLEQAAAAEPTTAAARQQLAKMSSGKKIPASQFTSPPGTKGLINLP